MVKIDCFPYLPPSSVVRFLFIAIISVSFAVYVPSTHVPGTLRTRYARERYFVRKYLKVVFSSFSCPISCYSSSSQTSRSPVLSNETPCNHAPRILWRRLIVVDDDDNNNPRYTHTHAHIHTYAPGRVCLWNPLVFGFLVYCVRQRRVFSFFFFLYSLPSTDRNFGDAAHRTASIRLFEVF